MKSRLLDALKERPILLDAAMGTRLIARGLDLKSDDPSLWVSECPEIVWDLHRGDIESGSEALLTNTFGANRIWLKNFGYEYKVKSLNERAVSLAREVAGPDRFVFGSIGPTASGHTEAVREQAEILVQSGVDALMLETHTLEQAGSSLVVLNHLPVPMLVSLFVWPDPLQDAVNRLIDRGAAVIGANCQNGMEPAVELVRRLRDITDQPLFIKPSAGLPGSSHLTPRTFADAVPELVGCGVRLIGGCCGTTEAHVRAMREALNLLLGSSLESAGKESV